MADDLPITVIGNLTADPELRFTPSGAAVANFTVAHTPRFFDKQSQEWKDKETLFIRCAVWREAAENVAESLQKGMKVIAYGKLEAKTYQTKEGESRTNWELDVTSVGPDLFRATAKVFKKSGGGGGSYGSGGGFGGSAPARGGGAPQGGPGGFGGAPSQGQGGPWGGQQDLGAQNWQAPGEDEPPF